MLEGLAVVQPVTFSPDGGLVYATTANPEPDGCRLHALDAENGRTVWCRTFPPSIAGSAVVVDAEGHVGSGPRTLDPLALPFL